jgi:hypothetical protein
LIDIDGSNEETPNEWKLGNLADASEKLIPKMIDSLFEEAKI